MDADRLLNTNVEDLVRYFTEKYSMEAARLLNPLDPEVDVKEANIDVTGDPRYDHRGQRPFVPGTEVVAEVQFEGDASSFWMAPSTRSSLIPFAELNNQTLILRHAGTQLDPQQVQAQIRRRIDDIQQHLQWLRADMDTWNRSIDNIARSHVEARRTKLLADRKLADGLGMRLKPRGEATRTYPAPEVRRKIVPKMPAASSSCFKPEPRLEDADYEHVLNVIDNMAMVMERSPKAFHDLGEETIRSHILVQLNGHFEGAATGETFNYEGKTDILIRSDGRNVFIGECKVWSGPSMMTQTIDQLLGYLQWRDTKAAIVVFNRNRDFTAVLGKMDEVTRAHPNFKRFVRKRSETSFQYVIAQRDDANREIALTVLAFDVPGAGASSA